VVDRAFFVRVDVEVEQPAREATSVMVDMTVHSRFAFASTTLTWILYSYMRIALGVQARESVSSLPRSSSIAGFAMPAPGVANTLSHI
jgi:hypothetical protein